MNLDLAGKRVLVTGSSHGIGLSIVKSFERQGALVVSNGRDSKRLEKSLKGISIPLADHGVRINGVAPGNILFKNSVWDKKIKKDSLAVQKIVDEKVPLRKLGSPDDVANFVLWLSSPISNFVTGSIHVTDGGQTRN